MRHIILCSLIAVLSLTLCRAGEIVLPASALERDAPVTAYYRTNSKFSVTKDGVPPMDGDTRR